MNSGKIGAGRDGWTGIEGSIRGPRGPNKKKAENNRSGWGKFYHSNPTKFLGGENATEQTLVFPGFGTTGIDWSEFVLSFGFENLS